MSIFRRFAKHGDKTGSNEVLSTSSRDHPRSSLELAKQGLVGPLFEKLVDGGRQQLAEVNDAKQTLLHVAAEHGHKPVVKLLLLHPAVHVDCTDHLGNTPLMLACLHKRIDVISFLLRKNADVKHVNSDGVTILHSLARHPFTEQLKTILDAVVQLGADKGAKDKFGETPLQRACASLNTEVAGWFLNQEVDVNSANQFGETALHKATRMLHADAEKAFKLIELLLSKGANSDVSGEHGTALEVASQKTLIPQLSEMFAKAKERRMEKQQKLLGINVQSRLVDLPPDWSSRDSKQKSAYLMQKWDTLKKKPSAKAAAEETAAATTTTTSGMTSTSQGGTETADDENGDGVPELSEEKNLSSTLLMAEAEKKDLKADSSEKASPVQAPPPVNPICQAIEGFRVENGTPRDRPLSPRAMVLDFPPEPYKKTYVQQKHWNFVGYLNVVGEEKKEPAAISILMRNNEELGFTTCAALIRTQLGVVELPVRPPPGNPTPSELLATLMADKTRFTGNPHFVPVDNPELIFEYLEYEKNDPQRCTSLPIGIIYVPRANMSHLEIWDSSNQTSPAFEQFLQIIGDRVTLQGWSGYAGGLDTLYDKKGKYSVYTRWRGLEIMFHVSTLLPYNPGDHAKVQIARVIGNDITNVVFFEGDGEYNPATFNSAVTHVYGIVHPEASGSYRTAFASKAYVPKFGPELPPELSKEQFKDMFLAKLVNGHFASQRSKGLNMMYSRPREVLLRALVEQFEKTVTVKEDPRTAPMTKKDKKEKEKEKKEEKEKKKEEERQQQQLLASQKRERRKSMEVTNVSPLKQLLSDATKEKDKDDKSRRKNSPAPTKDKRMTHSGTDVPENEGAKLSATKSTPAASEPIKLNVETCKSDGAVSSPGKKMG